MTLEKLEEVSEAVFKWSRDQKYRGYNKHDGLNSPVLKYILGWGKWPRMIAIQTVMRFPINLRPLLLTPKVYNPKGLALFSQALMDRYKATGRQNYLEEAIELLILLENLVSHGDWHGIAWGYHYPWQDPGFYAPKAMPNAVVTSFVCEAFLDAYRLTNDEKYIDIVGSAINFFMNDLNVLKDKDDELCLGYMPVKMNMRVMDVSILIGTVIAQYAEITNDQKLKKVAHRLVNYVMNQQTDYYAWYYTDPPSDSLITHDNYHTGFILDALWRYMNCSNNREWETKYKKGLEFYASHHFTDNGAPKWMHNKEYPYDIHGAAQGILTFSRHMDEYPGFAMKIANWAIKNMYHREGRFYYQQTRWYKKKFTLLRWCNGWMSKALSNYLLYQEEFK